MERRGGSGQKLYLADREGERGDMPGYTPTPEYLRLQEVYGDWFHANSGTHLDGRIGDDKMWQGWWHDLAFMPSQRYDAPSGEFGQRFVVALVGDLQGVQERLCNLEWCIVFQTVILQLVQNVTASQAIR